MLNIVICDDDPVFAERFSKKIREKTIGLPADIEAYVYTFTEAGKVLEFAKTKPVHILFLDIDMKGMNGFELARAIHEQSEKTLVIFVSGYDNFVYSSFKFNPFDYMRKSHIDEETDAVFKSAVQKFMSDSTTAVFKTVDGDMNIRINDIIYIESERNYFAVHCGKNTAFRCRGALSTAEPMLAAHDFYRINSSVIVNLDNISSVKSNRQVTMSDGAEFIVSQGKYPGFRAAYLDFSRRRIVKL